MIENHVHKRTLDILEYLTDHKLVEGAAVLHIANMANVGMIVLKYVDTEGREYTLRLDVFDDRIDVVFAPVGSGRTVAWSGSHIEDMTPNVFEAVRQLHANSVTKVKVIPQ